MSNYSATVVKITNLRPHSNADRLVCTEIFGNTVIVGKETKIGDVGLYFPLESQIGLEYAQANDLLRRKDANGKSVGGMFDANRRVRAQTFRGEKSMGFFMPIESIEVLNHLADTGVTASFFTEGMEIEKLGTVVISQKYIIQTHGTKQGFIREGRKPRESRIVPDQFRFHFDTAQLGKNIHKLEPSDIIVVTWKLHGTSAIVAKVLVKRSLSWLEKLLQFFVEIADTTYDYVYASRRVVKNEFQEAKEHFYGHDLWSEIGNKHFGGRLRTGETIYYEIVGFTKDGSYIQKDFDYGCVANPIQVGDQINHVDDLTKPQHKVFVYRITQTAADGSVVELQWNQVKDRCAQLDVNHVPEIWTGQAYELLPLTDFHENAIPFLKENFVNDQDSIFCENKVPEEGICVRKEGSNPEIFKLKSFRFLEYETKALDKGEENIEDAQLVNAE